MATIIDDPRRRHRALGTVRLLLSGAITAAVIFGLCWIGALLAYSGPTHAYVSLFTAAPIASGRAWVEGTAWSLLFGGLSAAVFGLVYNSVAAFERRWPTREGSFR